MIRLVKYLSRLLCKLRGAVASCSPSMTRNDRATEVILTRFAAVLCDNRSHLAQRENSQEVGVVADDAPPPPGWHQSQFCRRCRSTQGGSRLERPKLSGCVRTNVVLEEKVFD